MQMQIKSIEELKKVAQSLLHHHKEARVFALQGEMGVGKTTFVKSLCEVLDSDSLVSSPTFTIVNEYVDKHLDPIYHFDLYRLESIDDVRQIGAEDYFYSGHYCFVEWPEIASLLMPDNVVYVKITVNEITKSRMFEF
ncbi:MAG: tRNA (adenosine(37)-N6)-threonylcarbamoyltransferase complex ATPase subunit type 1 TsaE [Bacteroidales bacterium]|nr:tRNA (adenosine(37)-N6)-threonylcarbamoyltransferase complex ATPase subunit type 1 TsaE [Bacteroidales bacterium]MDD4574856.1 tRNA (adenosine(37)-N6)-threonylcarbamoyltransferase complex ATPase subunit type 1 TsaE [Bacteroidales bacterium]